MLAASLLVGCDPPGEGSPAGSAEPSPSATPATPVRSTGSSEPVELPSLVLIANVGERPPVWEVVAHLPFGPGQRRLGYVPASSDDNLAVVPTSFAVADDGSLWVLDGFKERVAHYSAGGRFLGDAGRFPWESGWEVRDLQWHDGRLFVLLGDSGTVAAAIGVVRGSRQDPMVPITSDGDPVIVYSLVPGTTELVGELHGWAGGGEHALGGGPSGWAEIDVPGSGDAALLPGIPLAEGGAMDLRYPLDERSQPQTDRLEVRFVGAGAESMLPLRFRLVAGEGETPRRHLVSASVQAALAGGLVAFVRISTSGGRPSLGGWWYLQVSSDGSALAWEPLPLPGIATELQVRYLTVAPDGAVHLMLADEDGVTILRR